MQLRNLIKNSKDCHSISEVDFVAPILTTTFGHFFQPQPDVQYAIIFELQSASLFYGYIPHQGPGPW